jgi:hypothetical protein
MVCQECRQIHARRILLYPPDPVENVAKSLRGQLTFDPDRIKQQQTAMSPRPGAEQRSGERSRPVSIPAREREELK